MDRWIAVRITNLDCVEYQLNGFGSLPEVAPVNPHGDEVFRGHAGDYAGRLQFGMCRDPDGTDRCREGLVDKFTRNAGRLHGIAINLVERVHFCPAHPWAFEAVEADLRPRRYIALFAGEEDQRTCRHAKFVDGRHQPTLANELSHLAGLDNLAARTVQMQNLGCWGQGQSPSEVLRRTEIDFTEKLHLAALADRPRQI